MNAGDVVEYTACVVYAPVLSRPYVAFLDDLLTDKSAEAPGGYHLGGEGDSPEEALAHLEWSIQARTGKPCRPAHIRYELTPTDDAHEGL